MMDKLFDGSDAHLLGANAELIQRLNEPDVHYPGNFDTVKRANAILMCLCQEAADALEAAHKRIAELEAAIIGWKADQKENMATAVEECKRANESERKLAVAREAIQQTIAENGHLADGEVCTLKSLKQALAQIGGGE